MPIFKPTEFFSQRTPGATTGTGTGTVRTVQYVRTIGHAGLGHTIFCLWLAENSTRGLFPDQCHIDIML